MPDRKLRRQPQGLWRSPPRQEAARPIGAALRRALSPLQGEDKLQACRKRYVAACSELVCSMHFCLLTLHVSAKGGFAAHIDAPAYTHIKDVRHLTILLAVDESNMNNGGLEVVEKSHKMKIPIGEDLCIDHTWAKEQKWVPVELAAGTSLHSPYALYLLPIAEFLRTFGVEQKKESGKAHSLRSRTTLGLWLVPGSPKWTQH